MMKKKPKRQPNEAKLLLVLRGLKKEFMIQQRPTLDIDSWTAWTEAWLDEFCQFVAKEMSKR